MIGKLVLIRHGESIWNVTDRLTGWTDVPLTEKGIAEAVCVGKYLRENGFVFDKAYCSMLKRTEDTLKIIIEQCGNQSLSHERIWRLNENHYGVYQGFQKNDLYNIIGKEKLEEIIFSYHSKPPLLDEYDARFPGNDPLYKDVPQSILPKGESLTDLHERVICFWKEKICSDILEYKNIIVVSHGNAIREIINYLNIYKGENLADYKVPTALPLILEYSEGAFKVSPESKIKFD